MVHLRLRRKHKFESIEMKFTPTPLAKKNQNKTLSITSGFLAPTYTCITLVFYINLKIVGLV